MRLNWPPRPRNAPPAKEQQPASLALRVEPGFGLDIQHMSSAIVERVNTHLGWRCVAKIAIHQEPLRRAAPKRSSPPPSDPAARARAEDTARGVENDGLRAALVTLGERIMSEKARS